jgi:transcriptional regulator with PAS, ATPase and Fis domain
VIRIAQGGISVLILGETGAGKEVLARTLHQLSRREGQFVAVNCAALTEALLESELFGHERGAFTGAASAKPGLFEIARGGTVFLDEVGELSHELQAKLLRVLETREAYRLGATAPTRLDVRFLAATHRDLEAEVVTGSFRRDFWFRINGITLTIPPLRDRRAAIPALAEQFLADAARAAGRTPPRLDRAALAALVRHAWPGNVRELRTVMERAVMLASSEVLAAADILIDRAATSPPEVPAPDGKARLAAIAAEHHGNVTRIAQALGTSRSQVRRLAKRHGLDLDRYR